MPYSASLGSMYCLTLSAWVYYPSGTTNAGAVPNKGQQLFNLWTQNGGNPCYQFGYYLPEPNERMEFTASGSESSIWESVWNVIGGNGPDYTPGQWAQWTMVYNGNNGTAGGDCYIFQNGVCVSGGAIGYTGQLYHPASGQAMQLAGGDNEWLGSLDNLGMWNVALTNGCTMGTPRTVAAVARCRPSTTPRCTTTTRGRSLNTASRRWTNCSPFTTRPTRRTSPLLRPATALWLGGTSPAACCWAPAAGQPVSGQYAVQLDSAGGGVETVLPGDANFDGNVNVNDLTVVLTNFGRTSGTSWGTGDFNGDGTVDVNDLTIVLSHFGQSVGVSGGTAAAVPEPASLALLIGCGFGTLGIARSDYAGNSGSVVNADDSRPYPPSIGGVSGLKPAARLSGWSCTGPAGIVASGLWFCLMVGPPGVPS